MKATLGAVLLAGILATAASASGDPVADAELPADLAAMAERFEGRVDREQDEQQFRLSFVRDPELSKDTVRKIRTREATWRRKGFEDLRVEGFGVVDLRARHGADCLTPLLAALFEGESQPFFVHTISGMKNPLSRDEGRRVVRELFAELKGGRQGAYLVTLNGNHYGNYRHAVLYVQSVHAPGVFLRYYFDLVHEI